MKICITGGSGFIGSAIAESLKSSEVKPLLLVRKKSSVFASSEVAEIDLGDLSSFDSEVLSGCDALIHTAARAHIMKDEALDPLTEYRRVNCGAVLELAKLAANAGVKRFVFLSSIGVNGINSNRPFTEKDKVAPHDDYSLSKYEAEVGLLNIAREMEIEVVVIRPPLVYGPGAPGNFKTLINWVRKPIPMPFGAIRNHRSFIALDNLIDFILLCANNEKSPKAANGVFLISDGEDISTSDFIRKVSRAFGVKSRLAPVPVLLMDFAARLFGKEGMSKRLFGNLQIDPSKARDLLGWSPVVSMDEQLEKIAIFDKRDKV